MYSFKRFLVDYGADTLRPNLPDNAVELASREVTGRTDTMSGALIYRMGSADSADLTLRWTRGTEEHIDARRVLAPDAALLNSGQGPREMSGRVVDLNTGEQITCILALKTEPGIASTEAGQTVEYVFHATQIKRA